MKSLFGIGYMLASAVTVWMLMAFVTWEPNPAQWYVGARLACAALWVGLCCAILASEQDYD
jgi:hypothetical protein